MDIDSCECGVVLDLDKTKDCEFYKHDQYGFARHANGFICPVCGLANFTNKDWDIDEEELLGKYSKVYVRYD